MDNRSAERPYVICSCAMSVDGRIDDCSDQRLMLSGPADLDRVDEVRAGCDAILVGAGTVRRDDPRLAVRSEVRRATRVAAGLEPTPRKVVLCGSGTLDPAARLFDTDPVDVLVYTCGDRPAGDRPAGDRPAGDRPGRRGGSRTVMVELPALAGRAGLIDVATVLDDLARRGVRRLLVEGGTSVHTAFLTAGLVDELHLVVAPLFVGEADAPAFVGPGRFPRDARARMRLAEVRQLDDVVLARYLIHPATTR
ncbi:dihydrofolate reductase family protein [Frankia sp. AgPm24]|uniref:RibD family protein n=1 Tax=Frankia sp. AgPm24 TaxID=631128 RepID=UPI00200C12C3|nr:dihydrofolate reductase family protein [Frankia sp. AgPm24]MCK9920430.1 dihydrofolate reductase family protein [Frankia sp. AgPm24]